VQQLNKTNGQLEQMIWENSTCTAFAALSICKLLRKDYVEESFLMGLLHDLGKLVLLKQIPLKYSEALKKTSEGMDYNTTEQVVLGFGHPLIGALVAKKWDFSPMLCEVILRHHDLLPDDLSDRTMEATAVIQAANLLAHKLGHAHPPGYPDQSAQADSALITLGLSNEHVDFVTADTEKLFAERLF
jgi:HD-like signal output (HDOD) protein